jgi:hypothetical protein
LSSDVRRPSGIRKQHAAGGKVVTAGGTVTIRIRPLKPGGYRFFNDFHPETQDYLVVSSRGDIQIRDNAIFSAFS